MNKDIIKKMTDSQLIEQVEYLVRRERQLVECLILHLQEIQDRKLFLQMGFVSLFECLVKHFKYSESSAYARISVLKILKEVPQVAQDLSSGELNLTNLTLVQSFIKKQEKQSGQKISTDEKIKYLATIKNKNTIETKQILAQMDPEIQLPADQLRYLDSQHVQLQITTNKKVLQKIEHLKSLISHSNINPSFGEILEMSLDAAIEKIEKKNGIHFKEKSKNEKCIENIKTSAHQNVAPGPFSSGLVERKKHIQRNKSIERKILESPHRISNETLNDIPTHSFAVRNSNSHDMKNQLPKNALPSRYIPATYRKNILFRSKNQCEHIYTNGKRCSSKFQLQFDHIKAFSRGGSSEENNIQILCRVHNAVKSNL